MNNKKNLAMILASSAVLAGCSYTPKNETYNQSESSKEYDSIRRGETLLERRMSGKELEESWNEAWQRQNLHRAADLLSK